MDVKPFGWVRNGYIRLEEPPPTEAAFTPPYEPVYNEATVKELQRRILALESLIDNEFEPDRRW